MFETRFALLTMRRQVGVETPSRRMGYTTPMATRSELEATLRRLAPKMPPHEFSAVIDHARDSAGLRSASPESAAWLSLIAYLRHTFTDYDALLKEGYDRDSARHFVAGEMQALLQEWGVTHKLGAGD
jgi:hypothetical protein